MMKVETFCGGPADTNGYLLTQKSGGILIDAPEGMLDWVRDQLKKSPVKIQALLLTHGHWDHIVDAPGIQKELGVPILIHEDSRILLEKPEIQNPFNPFCPLQPCKADRVLKEEESLEYAGLSCSTHLCPGHCPGSLCFYFSSDHILFPGDVLFAGAVGRWDLPGGSRDELLGCIQQKLLPLPDSTRVLPGHGPATTIGIERKTNPYLQEGMISRRP